MRRYSNLKITKSRNRVFASKRNAGKQNKRAANSKSVPIEEGYFYNVTTGLHGDQFDTDPLSTTYGQRRGNDNGDFFEWIDELLRVKEDGPYEGYRTYTTWVDAPVHLNHDEDYTCGFVADSIPNFEDKSVEMVMATDVEKEPELCEQINNNEQTDVSMGCDLIWSICTHCGNICFNDADWCNCLVDFKGRKHPQTGRWVAEMLKDITGVEMSHITVGVGADPVAKNGEVLFKPELSRRSAAVKVNEMQAYYKQVLGIL